MKSLVVFCTIRCTDAFQRYASNFREYGHIPDILVVDETGETRSHIQKALDGFPLEFYGKKERDSWLYEHHVPSETIPPKTTDVIGFSLLVALQRKYDMIVFVDDDTSPVSCRDFLGTHWHALTDRLCRSLTSPNGWVNPHPGAFGRGYPYALRDTHQPTLGDGFFVGSVLNMGLWHGVPDLNAMDYLQHGSVTGQHRVTLLGTDSFTLGARYLPLSRMNIAFKPVIIPAFYQGTGDKLGVGRYGDVFSGLFLAKIARRVGDFLAFGLPHCIHDKAARDVYRDIDAELPSIRLNETLWQVLDQIPLHGKTYAGCYMELADGLAAHRSNFHLPVYIDYLVRRMWSWVHMCDEVTP